MGVINLSLEFKEEIVATKWVTMSDSSLIHTLRSNSSFCLLSETVYLN